MNRYEYLASLIAQIKPVTICEVGTNAGARAKMMVTEALKHQPTVHYTGFDLFEDATDETDAREFNAKPRCSLAQVKKDLDLFKRLHPGFTYNLVKGNTNDTLEQQKYDFAFIDGGHSVETILHDYTLLDDSQCVVLDDYYAPDDQGRMPDIEKYGCNSLVDSLIGGGEKVTILPFRDPVKDGGFVQMAVVGVKPMIKKQLHIITRNCVPDKVIKHNVRSSLKRKVDRVPHCKPHGLTAVVVSAGPSFKDYLKEVKELSRRSDVRVVCVKHNHAALLRAGVKVWACVLLDPRGHVKEFIEQPHPDVTYLVASQCEPAVFKQLRKFNVLMYHAHVGAGEEKLIDLDKEFMIGGGAASATRGVAVLHTMGFRKFKLYGFDGCYKTKPKDGYKVELPPLNGQPAPEFFTDPLRAAEGQDLQNLIKANGGMYMDVIGDGMIPHIFNVLVAQGAARRLTDLKDFEHAA